MNARALLAWLPLIFLSAAGCRPSTPTAPASTVETQSANDAIRTGEPVVRPAPAADPFEDLDPNLAKAIRGWKRGDQPPARLLQFPDGPPHDIEVCGLRALGDEVGDYISRVTDPDLLAALLFDPHADDRCIHATSRRLLELHGVRGVRALLADRRRTHPADLDRREVATLNQLLIGPYVRLKVASIAKVDVGKGAAEKVLAGLKADLAGGESWAKAYRRAADRLPDAERSRQQGGGSRTFVGYAYDGLVAPTGFDILNRRLAPDLDLAFLGRLFAAKGGTLIEETAAKYWLYHAETFEE